MYNFKNYVFEGGGVKGLAYAGVLKHLEEKGIHKQIERVAGASTGAVCALLVALDYSVEEIKAILWSVDFRNFMDSDKGIVWDIKRLMEDFGWYKGDFFEHWIRGIIEDKTGTSDTTFRCLHENPKYKSVTFIGTNLSTHYAEIFSYENTPDMKLSDALRITMSIPLFFKAIKHNDHVYVDGGLLMNYPVHLYDSRQYVHPHEDQGDPKVYSYNKQTLGFRLDSKQEIHLNKQGQGYKVYQINNLKDYLWHLLNTLFKAQENTHLHNHDWHRTVYIDTLGVETIDFDLSLDEKHALIQSGYDHTKRYFEWYDNPDNHVINR